MIAEYALAYGSPPPSDMPWPLFQLLLSRANAMFARQLLATMTGVGWGIGKGFGGKNTGGLDVMRRDVQRMAFPDQPKGTVFALKQSGKATTKKPAPQSEEAAIETPGPSKKPGPLTYAELVKRRHREHDDG